MRFSDIIGQDAIKRQLVRNIDSGRIPHAMILSNRGAYGAMPLAIATVQYIFCRNREGGDSCGVCPSCYRISHLEHADMHFSFPVNKSPFCDMYSPDGDVFSDSLVKKWREMILDSKPSGYFTETDWYKFVELGKNSQGIISRAEAASIMKKMSLKSFEGGYKAVIIWLPERMHTAAANALLKLFEEPEEKTLFLFVSENPDAILKTILSRTQGIVVPPIHRDDLLAYLESKYGESERCNVVARLAAGDVIEAEKMMTEGTEVDDEDFELFAALMRLCYGVNHLGLIEWAEGAATLSREGQKRFIEYSLKMLRESYVRSLGLASLGSLYGKEEAFIVKFAPFIHHKNIEKLVAEFELLLRQLSQNGNPKILFTHFALSISKMIVRL